jgi:hypothetical protein
VRSIQAWCAGVLALGVACMAMGGGFVYADFRAREGAWVDLQFRAQEPSAEQRERILEAWRDDSRTLIAFGIGAPGAGMFAFGLVGLVLSRRSGARATT